METKYKVEENDYLSYTLALQNFNKFYTDKL